VLDVQNCTYLSEALSVSATFNLLNIVVSLYCTDLLELLQQWSMQFVPVDFSLFHPFVHSSGYPFHSCGINLVVPRTRRWIGDRAFSVAALRAWNELPTELNCCDRRTRFVVIWKHFCFILSTGTRIRIDSVMRPRSSSRGAIQVPQLQLQCFSHIYFYSLLITSTYPIISSCHHLRFCLLMDLLPYKSPYLFDGVVVHYTCDFLSTGIHWDH